MYRIIYIAKNGKGYNVSFDGPWKLRGYEDKKGVRYDIDEKFTYDIRTVRWSKDWGVDEETTNKLLLRITFHKMQQLLDEGKEEKCEVTISRDNFPGKWPPSFIDYPKICSYRIETEEGLFCKAAAGNDSTGGATKIKICENICNAPEDFARCRLLIVETVGVPGGRTTGVLQRTAYRDCQIKDIDSEEECKECPDYEPVVLKSDVTGESLELARKLLNLGLIKPAGNVARIILEDYLKALCDNAPLEYDSNETIDPLAQKLRKAQIISDPEWGKIQWLARIGNNCSHPRKTVEREDVQKLIEEVGEFVGKPRPS